MSNVVAVCWDIVHLDAVWFDLIPLVNLFNRYDLNLHKFFFCLVLSRIGVFPCWTFSSNFLCPLFSSLYCVGESFLFTLDVSN